MAGKYQKSAAESREKRKSEMAELTRKTAESVIEFIESGGKSGQGAPAMTTAPFNPVSGHQYRGSNWLLAIVYMNSAGTSDPRFMTYKQATEYGEKLGKKIHVRAGESSVTFLRPMVIKGDKTGDEITDAPEPAREGEEPEKENSRVVWIPYRVFHASQIEGIPEWRSSGVSRKLDSGSLAEQLNVDRVRRLAHDFADATGVQFNVGLEGFAGLGPRYLAYYKSGTDELWMRPEDSYRNRADYVTTLMHELYHSTGHESRENRFLTGAVMTGQSKREYAIEEVRAEFFSLLTNRAFGIDERLSDSHKEYINHYREIASSDPHLIMRAAANAGTVFSGLMDFAHGEKPEQPWIRRGSKCPMFFNPPAMDSDGVPDVQIPADWTGEVSIDGMVELWEDDRDECGTIEPAAFVGVDPHFWGVYARCADGTSEHVADLNTREEAEELRAAMMRSVDAIMQQNRERAEEAGQPFVPPRRETLAETIERIKDNIGAVVEWRVKPGIYESLTAPSSESTSLRGVAVGVVSSTGYDHAIEIRDDEGQVHRRHLIHGDVEIVAALDHQIGSEQDAEAETTARFAQEEVADPGEDAKSRQHESHDHSDELPLIDEPDEEPAMIADEAALDRDLQDREELRSFGFS